MLTAALLATCLVDQVHPEIGIATVALLERAGFEVAFPTAQTCCGQPFFNAGYHADAVRLAKRTIEIFEPFEAVVLPSGSCTAMLRVEYAHLFEGDPDWGGRAAALAEKTFELSDFLLRHTSRSEVEGPTAQATYHDSCHMCRLLGLKGEPRAALGGAGIEVVEMEESDRCCGFGGAFSVKMPEVSEAMTHEKLRRAAATGADTLVTADPGCLMQMRRFAGEHGIRVEHLAVILNDAGESGRGAGREASQEIARQSAGRTEATHRGAGSPGSGGRDPENQVRDEGGGLPGDEHPTGSDRPPGKERAQ